MIVRDWQEQGEQMRMFQKTIYCPICKRFSSLECAEPGDSVQCGNPTCKVRGVLEQHNRLRNRVGSFVQEGDVRPGVMTYFIRKP